ncbi:MAG: GNAT family N-acetyltransferase [archaeon]|nr:GNAT family N-acetyltransferase [archaeon]
MEFKPATSADSKELSEYLHPIWHEVFDDIMLKGAEEAEYIFTTWTNPEAIAKSIDEDGYEYGFIEVDGKRAGLYSYHIQDDGRFYVNKLYLDSAFRGKGLGQAGLNIMKDIAIKNGCTEMYLNVYFYNEKAIKAYLRFGMNNYYRCLLNIGNGITRNDYVMSMKL